MKPWKKYFDDIGDFFLARKAPLMKAKTTIDSDPWYTTRVGAIQDFLRINDLKKQLAEQQNRKSQDQRTLSEVSVREARKNKETKEAEDSTAEVSRNRRPSKISETLGDVKQSIDKAKVDTAQLNIIVAQADIYAVEGSLAAQKAARITAALQAMLQDPDEGPSLYANQPPISVLCDKIKESDSSQKETEALRIYLESILPLDPSVKTLTNIPRYESPETYYYTRVHPMTTRSRAMSAYESMRSRRGSAATAATSPTGQTDTIDLAAIKDVPMPTFGNTIGLGNVLRHPLSALSYSFDAITKTVFEVPAEFICRGISAAYNGLFRAGNWLANKIRGFTNQPTVTADPNDSTALRTAKIITNNLLIIPPLFLGIRTASLALAKTVGSVGGLRDEQFAEIARQQVLAKVRTQEFEDEKKRRLSKVSGKKPFLRGNSTPNLFEHKERKNSIHPHALLPGMVNTEDKELNKDIDDLELGSLASTPILHLGTLSSFPNTGSEENYNTFSPHGTLDSSTGNIQRLFIDTNAAETNPATGFTPLATMRSSRHSSAAAAATTPSGTPHGHTTRYQTWVSSEAPLRANTETKSPLPSPKPTHLLSPQQVPGRAKTLLSSSGSPTGARLLPTTRTATTLGQVSRIEEGSRNNSDEHSPKSPKSGSSSSNK